MLGVPIETLYGWRQPKRRTGRVSNRPPTSATAAVRRRRKGTETSPRRRGTPKSWRSSSTSATDYGATPVRWDPIEKWAADWIQTRHDLRLTTRTRLDITLSAGVAQVRHHPAGQDHQRRGAIADNRLAINPAISVPLPSEPLKPPRFLSRRRWSSWSTPCPSEYKAVVLLGAYAGLRWGEAVGLTRASIDVLRSRITVASTAVEVRGHVTLGNEPKTSRSKRTVPVARSVMRRLEEHHANFVGPESDALVFTAPRGGPLARSLFSRRVWQPAVIRAGIPSITFQACAQALWRSWSRLATTSGRFRSGPATTASRSR